MITTSVPAAEQVANLETSEAPSAESIAAARVAVAAELAAIEAKVFPSNIPPVSADAIKAYEFHTGRLSLARFGDGMADLHRRSLDEHPELALMLRTADPALADVAAAAARPGASGAGSAAVRAYQRQVTIALVEDCDAPSDARTFLETIALEDRLAAVEARAAEHAAAAAAAVEAERRAALRADLDRALAALAAADAVAVETRAAADAAERARHETRCTVLAERLRLSGCDVLRTGHEVFDVPELIRIAPQLGAFDVSRFIAALDRIEASS